MRCLQNLGKWTLVALAIAVGGPMAVQSADSVKVEDILNNPDTYLNEVVVVEGQVVMRLDASTATTTFYQLRDDYGVPIKVRTSRTAPEVGHRYQVTGTVGVDVAAQDEYFLAEESRTDMSAPPPAPTPAPTEQTRALLSEPEPAPSWAERLGLERPVIWVLGGILVVLGVASALLLQLARSRSPKAEVHAEAPPVEPQVVEGQTIKLHSPPPGTLKILPGRLEIVSGEDKIKEIRFYRVNSQSVPEITFGRASGPPFTHVEFKNMTVSARQAKLSMNGNSWRLINFASQASNPTKLNGVELGVDAQTALNEGDRIEMGEVAFSFHRN